MSPLAVLLAVVSLAVLPGPAAAATARTSLPDVEDEVMCVECGTPLEVSQSPVANQERALIRRDIAKGMTKEQIKADLVDQYGRAVLADPSGGGIDTAVWLVPVILVPLAALGAVLAARRWRRRGSGPASGAPPTGLDPADARRLDAELASFDS